MLLGRKTHDKTMTTKRFKIGDMECVNCAMTIDDTLENIDGISTVKTTYFTSETKVTFDPKIISSTRIITLIKDAGYSAAILLLN